MRLLILCILFVCFLLSGHYNPDRSVHQVSFAHQGGYFRVINMLCELDEPVCIPHQISFCCCKVSVCVRCLSVCRSSSVRAYGFIPHQTLFCCCKSLSVSAVSLYVCFPMSAPTDSFHIKLYFAAAKVCVRCLFVCLFSSVHAYGSIPHLTSFDSKRSVCVRCLSVCRSSSVHAYGFIPHQTLFCCCKSLSVSAVSLYVCFPLSTPTDSFHI